MRTFPPQASIRDALAIVVVAAAITGVVVTFDSGWLPHDDGYLAWSAERVLNGQVLHVDYDEIYTGGLSYLNAAAFRVLGTDLLALRVPLLVLFFLFVLSAFLTCRRGMSRPVAAATTAIVVSIGPLLTPTPMPTLYNLYLGGIALLCLFRFAETRSSVWLMYAGLLTGFSTLIKVSGLYVFMGLCVALMTVLSATGAFERMARGAVLVGTAAATTILLAPALTISRAVSLLLPILIVLFAVNRGSPMQEGGHPGIIRGLGWLSLGFTIPLAAFVVLFASRGHLSALTAGLTGMIGAVAGQLHLDTKPLLTLLVPIGLVLIYGLLLRVGPKETRAQIGVIAIFALGWYLLHPRSQLLAIHHVLSWIVPISAFVFWWMTKTNRDRWGFPYPVMVLALAVCFHLVKFPSANQWQIAYTAPLGVIALLMLANQFPRQVKLVTLTALASFGLVFALARFNGQIYSSTTVGLSVPYIELESERAGIKVPMVYWYYNEINSEINDDAEVFATPDLPEIYFLNGQLGVGRGVFPLLSQTLRPTESEVTEFLNAEPDVVVIDTAPVISVSDPDLEPSVAADCGPGTLIGRLKLYVCDKDVGLQVPLRGTMNLRYP